MPASNAFCALLLIGRCAAAGPGADESSCKASPGENSCVVPLDDVSLMQVSSAVRSQVMKHVMDSKRPAKAAACDMEFCSSTCQEFEYCLTHPDANCDKAVELGCEKRCSGCAPAAACDIEFCASTCQEFEYCLTHPDANCDKAVELGCERRCSGCAPAAACDIEFCSSTCQEFAYCLTHPDANCDKAVELGCDQRCSGCTHPTSPEAAPPPACEGWCASHTASWEVKCGWETGACAGCSECATTTRTWSDTCHAWCVAHTQSWEIKCGWGECLGCPECPETEKAIADKEPAPAPIAQEKAIADKEPAPAPIAQEKAIADKEPAPAPIAKETAIADEKSSSSWVKGSPGSTCGETCAAIGGVCNAAAQSALTTQEAVAQAFQQAGYSCQSSHGPRGYGGAPFSTGRASDDCAPVTPGGNSSCHENTHGHHSPLCSCQESSSSWFVGRPGSTCGESCAAIGRVCNAAEQSTLTTQEAVAQAFQQAGYSCQSFHGPRGYGGAPFSTGRASDDCAPITPGGNSSCHENTHDHHSPLCSCQETAISDEEPEPAPIAQETAIADEKEVMQSFMVVDGCTTEGSGDPSRLVNHGQECTSMDGTAGAVRCCSMDGSTCASRTGDSCFGTGRTYQQAVEICADAGMRLCTAAEVATEMCCGTGCNYDWQQVWTSDSCGR